MKNDQRSDFSGFATAAHIYQGGGGTASRHDGQDMVRQDANASEPSAIGAGDAATWHAPTSRSTDMECLRISLCAAQASFAGALDRYIEL